MPNVIESKYVREAMRELVASMPNFTLAREVRDVMTKALREEKFIGDRVGAFENIIDTRVDRLTQARLNNRDWG